MPGLAQASPSRACRGRAGGHPEADPVQAAFPASLAARLAPLPGFALQPRVLIGIRQRLCKRQDGLFPEVFDAGRSETAVSEKVRKGSHCSAHCQAFVCV